MGQVYQAYDTLLGRLVAVKFLSSTNPDETTRERFVIEARAIARLAHPNVLSIYRVGWAGGRPYLASEFLRGQSLDKVGPPLPWRRVLDIALQLSRGLAAAHRQGVLHRDLKPANVMLTEDGTAKLLDFGLAKLSDGLTSDPGVKPRDSTDLFTEMSVAAAEAAARSGDYAGVVPTAATLQSSPALMALQRTGGGFERSATMPAVSDSVTTATEPGGRLLTVAGAILGTPAYMAPEAWRGEIATPQTDIYGLGAILYELCSGGPPHRQERLEELALAVVDKDPRPLAEAAPEVNRRLTAIIHRCLQRDPARRFADGIELQQALEALATEVAAPSTRAVLGRALRRRWLVALIVAGSLLVPPSAALYYFYQVRSEQRHAAAVIKNRRAIALVGLQDLSGGCRPAGFSAAFLELLGAELTVGEQLRRVPADRVARMKIDLKLVETTAYSAEVLHRIRDQLGADLVVTGTCGSDAKAASRLQTRIIVQDAQSSAPLAATDVQGSPSELLELVARTGTELRQQLGITGLSSADTAALRAARPTSPEVALSYAEGRERLRRFDAAGARSLIEKAVAVEPDYPLGHLAMADVWTALGYDARARAEAKRAFELSANLPREDRYLIEARHRESGKEWERAFAAYQTLLTFFPESLDYGLYLGNAQLAAGLPEAARATARRLRARPAPVSQDPRLDILEARAAADTSDYVTAQSLLGSAARKGESLGAPLLVARAHLEAAYALSLGEHDQAIKSAALAKPLFVAAGDRGAAADALMAMSNAYFYKGDIEHSLDASREAHELLLEIENSALAAANLCNMALILVRRGDLDLARLHAEAGVLLSREIGLQDSTGGGLITLGWIAILQGDLSAASRSFKKAEAVFSALNDPKMTAWLDWHVGQVYLLRGELALARKQHEHALALRLQHGLKGFAAESQAALAAVALEESRPAEAESFARAAAAQFAQEHQADSEAWALSLLSAALAAQGRLPEAAPSMERALLLVASCPNKYIQLSVRRRAIALKAMHQKDADRMPLIGQLSGLLSEAKAAGILIEELEIRLAQYESLPMERRTAEQRQQIQDLLQEATKRDLKGLALKAQRLLN